MSRCTPRSDPGSGAPRHPRVLVGLLIPASVDRAVTLCPVPDVTAAIGDLLGVQRLDDLTMALPDGELLCLYRDEEHLRLPGNPRLAGLLTGLGAADRHLRTTTLHGDTLVLGGTDIGTVVDLDVPDRVVTACLRHGIRPDPQDVAT